MSYISYLQCSQCGDHFDPEKVQTFCTKCQAPLLARYDLDTVRGNLDRDEIRHCPRGMWRWGELLPVLHENNVVTLGKGMHPCCLYQTLE